MHQGEKGEHRIVYMLSSVPGFSQVSEGALWVDVEVKGEQQERLALMPRMGMP